MFWFWAWIGFKRPKDQKFSSTKSLPGGKIRFYIHKRKFRGLVVRVKIHVQEVVSSNPGPAAETIYHAPLIWIKKHGKVTWHCCMCCNPAKGRVEFEDSWLIKSSFITKGEMTACQLTRTKIQQKTKQQKKNSKLLDF